MGRGTFGRPAIILWVYKGGLTIARLIKNIPPIHSLAQNSNMFTIISLSLLVSCVIGDNSLFHGRHFDVGSQLHALDLRIRQSCLVRCSSTTCCNTGGPCIPSGGCCPAGDAVCPDGFGCCPAGAACAVDTDGNPTCAVPCTGSQVKCGSSCCSVGFVCSQLQGKPICTQGTSNLSPTPSLPGVSTTGVSPTSVSLPSVDTSISTTATTNPTITTQSTGTLSPVPTGTAPGTSLLPTGGQTDPATTSGGAASSSRRPTTSATSVLPKFKSGGARFGTSGTLERVIAGIIFGRGLLGVFV